MFHLGVVALLLTAQDFLVPNGFQVSEYAGSALANDIVAIAIDPKGRVAVSGPGYIRILVDDDRDGTADRAMEFAKEPRSGAHGMIWEGDTLIYVGDGGLRQLVDKDGDDRADGPSTLIRKLGTGGEHGCHGIRRGPDGWLYLVTGDHGGIDDSFAQLPTSPVKFPIGGCVVRFHPETWKSEIVAHGLRNAFGLDFDALGRLFTFDSDNERCFGMPWYEPTRLYQIVDGGFYGWFGPKYTSRLWRLPLDSPDTIPPIATFGRGSPTCVLAVTHQPNAEKRASTILIGDWTFGDIRWVRVPATNSSDDPPQSDVLLKPNPGSGFAPTAAIQDPKTGDVYVAIGGRGTRGAVYRITGYAPPRPYPRRTPLATETVDDPNESIRAAVTLDPLSRLRALERIARRRPDDTKPIRDDVAAAAIQSQWTSRDPLLIHATVRALVENPGLKIDRESSLDARRADILFRLQSNEEFDPAKIVPLIEGSIAKNREDLVFAALCLLQRRLELPAEPGPSWEGYTGRVSDSDRKSLAAVVTRVLDWVDRDRVDANLKREAIRTFVLVAPDGAAAKLVAWLKKETNPYEQFHLIAALAHFPPRLADGETAIIADALVRIDDVYETTRTPRESNWPVRFGELVAMLLRRDPNLGNAIVAHRDFGRPAHASLAVVKGFPRADAVPVFMKRLEADRDYPLTGRVLNLLADVPGDQLAALLRPHWGRSGLDEAILPFLARQPIAADRSKFVAGLKSLQSRIVQTSLAALTTLAQPADDDEWLALHTAWSNAGDKQPKLVAEINRRLHSLAGTTFADRSTLETWLIQNRPALAKRFAFVDGVDRLAWQKRLDGIDWSVGDIARGRAFYTKASCAACHSSTQTIGPDLAGVSSRFRRDDLFTAILQPNKDVNDRYRTLQVVTHDGKVHRGLVVYDAFDGLILRTGPADTVRIPGQSIESRAVVAQSLMPTGLLDTATDADIADLDAYLRSLQAK